MILSLLRKMFLVKEIVSKTGNVHFQRWRLLQTPWFAVYVHRICRSDEEADPHDHPWWYASFVLSGGYSEQVWYAGCGPTVHVRKPGSVLSHGTDVFHKLTLLNGPAWTAVLTGPRTHDPWGYRTDSGWTDHLTYRARKNGDAG